MNRGLALTGALVALSVSGCGSSATSAHTTNSPEVTVTPTGWTTTPFNTFTAASVPHPRAWRFVPPPPPTPAPWGTVGYFTNQTPHNPCVTTKLPTMTQVTCRGPISTLSPGGVIVTLSANQFVPNNRAGRTDTVVDGQRVEIKVYPATRDCPAGATGTESFKAYPPTPGRMPAGSLSEFDIDVCYNATGSPSLAAEVDRLIRGVRFH